MSLNIDDGLWLDDKTAHHFAHRMLIELEVLKNRSLARLKKVMENRGARPNLLGNPLSQKREFERMRKAFGPSLLCSYLESGKMVFTMRFLVFAGFPSHKQMVLHEVRFFRAPKSLWKYEVIPILVITEHALARMIQRGRVRETDHYIRMIGETWPLLFTISQVFTLLKNQDVDVSRLTLPLPVTVNSQPMILLTVCDATFGPVVKTVYKAEWKPIPEIVALDQALQEALQAGELNSDLLYPLVAAAKHFQRQGED